MTTYGDYSHIQIGRVFCKKCRKAIKAYNLQQLLDQTECLCATCRPTPKQEKSNGTV